MRSQKSFQLMAVVILVAVVVIAMSRGASGASTQDISGLDRRISMMEQRFYMLETSMNRLQQYVTAQRSTGSSSSDVRDRDVELLQAEVQRSVYGRIMWLF